MKFKSKRKYGSLTQNEITYILDRQDLVRYIQRHEMIVCLKCNHGVAFNNLSTHLHTHKIPHHVYNPIINALRHLPHRETIQDFPHPFNEEPPIQGLKIIDGFQCVICEFLTASRGMITTHKCRHIDIERDHFRIVKMQTWIPRRYAKYWVIIDKLDVSRSIIDRSNHSTSLSLSSSVNEEEERIVQDEHQRIEEQQSEILRLHEGNNKYDVTPWLKWTRWSQRFEGKNLKVTFSKKSFSQS